MRVLRFDVNDQIISKDPECDFNNIVPGTSGYLKAEFIFSKEWDNFVKVASFYRNGRECSAEILEDGKTCIIPSNALVGRRFAIKISGREKDNKNIRITTSMVEIIQNGG